MNVAVMRKTFRDARLLLVVLCAAIVLFEVVLVAVLRGFWDEVQQLWGQVDFIRRLIESLLGADLAANFSPTNAMTIVLAHPILFTCLIVLLLTTGTRAIVGEVDRGTADLLLSLPLSRARVYGSASAVCGLIGVPVTVAPLVGITIGQAVFPPAEPFELARLCLPIVNLFALYLALSGATVLVSSFTSRRGHAIAVVLAFVLASLFLDFLVPFNEVVARVGFLGLFHYYQPLVAVESGELPVVDTLILAAVAAVFWLIGLWRFAGRDIPAV